LKQLLDNIRVFNDDLADNPGAVHLEAGEDKRVILARHPRLHVALAIMSTGAISLMEDIDNDPVTHLMT